MWIYSLRCRYAKRLCVSYNVSKNPNFQDIIFYFSKCRKSEKERRIKLREKFNELAKALPSYDPSKPLCHVNILEEARIAIEELQEDIKKIVTKSKDGVKGIQAIYLEDIMQ